MVSSGKTGKFANSIINSLNHLFWPAVCINCSRITSEEHDGICENCWSELSACCNNYYCRRCGKDTSRYAIVEGKCPSCQDQQIFFDGIARAGRYQQAMQKMILKFKLSAKTEFLPLLSLMANSALQASSFYKDIELFVPVPLHFSRRLIRGYNQSLILAKKLKHPSAKINTELVQVRRTKLQPTMATPAKRAANVADAFAVRYKHNLSNKVICLVDDVKTTGATLNECAKTLKQAGASKVFALVLAVAGQNES